MAGYVIHISVGMEYLRKHHLLEYQDEFIQGVIAPDLVKDKSLTHYGCKSSEVDLSLYLQNQPINSYYDLGYFLHLVTDYLFYNYYIDTFSKAIYHDYDLLNGRLIEKYQIELPSTIQDQVFYSNEGDLTILNYKLVCKLIGEVSSLDLDTVIQEIKDHLPKWTIIRPLIRLD